MNLEELEANLEAILFAAGEAVKLDELKKATGQDEKTCRNVLLRLADRYDSKVCGLQIIELDGAFQLCTKPCTFDAISRAMQVQKEYVLTDTLLETLSVVAYRQPVTKLEIERIRGVKSDHPINKLIEYNLICEAGRLDAPGRPILFATTEEFLRHFGLTSTDKLPEIAPELRESFRQEAQEQMEFFLDS